MPDQYTPATRDLFKSPERALATRLANEAGLNPAQGRIAIELFLDHLENFFSTFRPPTTIIHTAVALCEPAGKPLKHCKTVPVTLSYFHEADLDVQREKGTVELRALRLYRFCTQAKEQGGLLSYEDLSYLLCLDLSTIKELVERLRQLGLFAPTRGAVKDIGREPSHKGEITNLLGRGYSTSYVAAATGHSEHSIARYQLQFAALLAMLHLYPDASDDQLCQLADLTLPAFLIYKDIANDLLQRPDCLPHIARLRNRFLLEHSGAPTNSSHRQIPPAKRPEDTAQRRLEQQSLDTALRQTIQEDLATTRRVAETVTLDLRAVIDQAFFLPEHLRPGEACLFVDALQTSYISGTPTPDRKVIPVTVPLATDDIKELWRSDDPIQKRRARVAVRIASAAYEQGGVMSITGLAELLHVSPGALSADLRTLIVDSQILPDTKGFIEDAGPTLTHKDWIVELDQHGFTGQEISWLTRHAPHSRDRYIKTYRRAEIIMNLEAKLPDAKHLANLLQLREGVAQQYVDLLRRYHPHMAPTPVTDDASAATAPSGHTQA